jgi:hypothetical protein
MKLYHNPITHVQLAKFDKKQGSESLLFHVPVWSDVHPLYFKIFLECFILTNETKILLNGLVLGACYNTCLWRSWNFFSTCKILLICFENTAVLFTCIFSIAITVVNNFNLTWYKIVHCGHFLQNTRIHLISSNFHRSYKTIFAYISHTNHRFCIGTLTYNALLPVQRFFSPFWTTERCHHTEYERVCPVKFWYYNNLITNQQNTLIIDKQTTKTTPNEVWKPQ